MGSKPLRTKLDIMAPESVGEHSLLLYLISDSYLGCDQQYELTLNVLEAPEDDEEEEEDEDDDL